MNKKIHALLGVSALALLVMASPAMASEVNVGSENVTTGANSDNENDYEVDNELDVDVDNDGDVNNNANGDVNTGNNDQTRNTEAGETDTGGVDASTDWESVINTGSALTDLEEELMIDADFLNEETGADSDNENELEVDVETDIELDNTADIMNRLGLTADTGHNEQTRNTTAGDIDTGDIGLEADIANYANNDSGVDGAVGATTVEVGSTNKLTGADSDNENEVEVDNDFDLDVDNDATLDTRVNVDANTGNNDQTRNTTAGDIDTGDVDVETDVVNSANNGSGVAGAAGGDLTVDVDAENNTTGADSDNENTVEVDNDVEIDVENDATVDNRLNVDADSGHNEQNRNTTGGDISTGDVSVDFTTTSVVNSN